MSRKLTRRVNIGHKVKISDNRPLPEPAESMVAPVLKHPADRQPHHDTSHPFGQKVSPFSMNEISTTLPTTKSSAVYSRSSILSGTEGHSPPSSRSTYCSGYDSADESGTIVIHDYMSDFGNSGTSFMSWSDDIDQETTLKLQGMFDGLEKFLHDEGDFPSEAGEDLLEECLLWKDTFPYKRSECQDQELSESGASHNVESNTPDSKGGLSQPVWKEKVTDLVVENLSSLLLSQIVETIATNVSELRNQCQDEEKSDEISFLSRSRLDSQRSNSCVGLTRFPAVHQKPASMPKIEMKLTKVNIDKMLHCNSIPIQDRSLHYGKFANPSALDSSLVPSSSSELQHILDISSPSLSLFGHPVVHRNALLPTEVSEVDTYHSAASRPLNFLTATDRRFSAFNSVFAGRKSPRQEAILKSLQEEREKCSAKNVKKLNASAIMHSNRIPMSHKPPWIGFTNVTLPPIDHVDESRQDEGAMRSSSTTRNRKISPTPLAATVSRSFFSPVPLEVQGTGLSRLSMAKKLVEKMSQPNPGVSRKFKK